MENKCEALPGVAYPGVRDNRSTINTKTGYDDSQFDFVNTTLKGFQMEEKIEDDLLFLAAAAACVTMRYVDDVFTMSSGNARIRTGPG